MSKLWVDDVREAPDETWVVARTSSQAIAALAQQPVDSYELMSLDHDLGEDDTAMRVVFWLEDRYYLHGQNYWPNEIRVHSANPVGRSNLLRAIQRNKP